MTATQVKDKALSILDEFEEGEVTLQSVHYCQVINPANVSEANIRKFNMPFGVFIPQDQAEAVGFRPTDWFEKTTITFNEDSDSPTEVKGYLTKRLRCCIIHRSQTIEVQERTSRGWQYIGPGYIKGQPTEFKQRLDNDRNSYRLRTRYLILFVDEDNNLLHEVPLQLGLGAGTGGAIGTEVVNFRSEFDNVYAKAKNKPGKGLGDAQHSCTVLDMTLGFHKPKGRAPFVCPIQRVAPALEQVGKEKEYSRRERLMKLIGVHYGSLLISPGSEAGKLIDSFRETYSDFPQPAPTKDTEEPTEDSHVEVFAETRVNEDEESAEPVFFEETELEEESQEQVASETDDDPIPF